jgi:hypothetical protein
MGKLKIQKIESNSTAAGNSSNCAQIPAWFWAMNGTVKANGTYLIGLRLWLT